MTPLGSAGGLQERVRVVAVAVAVGTVRIPGATKEGLLHTSLSNKLSTVFRIFHFNYLFTVFVFMLTVCLC